MTSLLSVVVGLLSLSVSVFCACQYHLGVANCYEGGTLLHISLC